MEGEAGGATVTLHVVTPELASGPEPIHCIVTVWVPLGKTRVAVGVVVLLEQ
jgi:hypothetical protein